MENFKKLQDVYLQDNLKKSLFSNKDSFKNKSNEIINMVHDDMNEILSNDAYAFHILKKIMPHEKVIKEILTYELLNYSPSKKVDTFDEFIKIATLSLSKFQYKVGGFNIEDKD